MPAVEIADSIVQSGRETLEKVCYLSSSEVVHLNERISGYPRYRFNQEMGRKGGLR